MRQTVAPQRGAWIIKASSAVTNMLPPSDIHETFGRVDLKGGQVKGNNYKEA